DCGDGIEMWAKRREPFGFDSRFIHVRVVEIGNFLRARSCRTACLGGLFNQGGSTLVAQISEHGENAHSSAVRRYYCALDPFAICVLIEIVSRFDGAIHIGDDNTMSVLPGRILLGCILRMAGEHRSN